MSNSLDPDHAQHFVGPDLGPNCLQSYQQMTLGGKELQILGPGLEKYKKNLGLSHKYKDAKCEIGK